MSLGVSSRPRRWVIGASTICLLITSLYVYFFVPRHGGNIYRLVTVPRPVAKTNSRTLVVARTKDADTSWVQELVAQDAMLSSAVYTVDSQEPSNNLTVPVNKGHEVMVYLTYIIEHYFELADITVFMHADRITWHNNDLMDMDSALMMRRLRNDYVYKRGYANLRCQQSPGCPAHIRPVSNGGRFDPLAPEAAAIGNAWKDLFPEERMPAVLAQPCCSQFAVSAEVVRRVPLMDYVSWRNWLIETKLDDGLSGRVWEYLWQWIFTGEAEVCPDERDCYCDGYGFCLGDEEYEEFFMDQFEVRRLHGELQKVVDGEKVKTIKNEMDALQRRLDEIKAMARMSR
ncbi:hypothetical protein BDV25DRAFT_44152 [Aspergillus avenaceus]|uniref:Uncharacterized protein n=1 Tax=Aspergillus avenaceus TaxID=36643 RepID=A0A5N6TKG9_ASPAV|nr:hypothetical protein BDV25DRAFT_44152 [Aspergillus avenaceus]